MNEIEKTTCDEVLRYGYIKNDNSFECEGINVRCYLIEYGNREYTLTKHNGEWIYFYMHN